MLSYRALVSTDAEQATRLLADTVGRYLAQLHVSAGDVQLLFDGGVLVRLAGTSRLANGAAVDEPQSLLGLALLLPLLNEEVQSAAVAPDGSLAVTFAAGALTCLPGDAYEAWEFRTESGALVVCMPGGDLAIWSDQG